MCASSSHADGAVSENYSQMTDKKTDIEKIRKLLAGFYAGETSPGDEDILARMLADADNLPADLEADRRLFAALHDGAEPEAVMPEEYTQRIDAALAKEFVRSGRNRFFSRKLFLSMTAAAALTAVVWTGFRMFMPRTETQLQHISLARPSAPATPESPAKTPGASASLAAITPQSSRPESNPASQGGKVRDKRTDPTKRQRLVAAETDFDRYDAYLTSEEEEMLAGRNYHVVENEAEAEVLLGAVFSRLEANIDAQESKIVAAGSSYEAARCSYISEINQIIE